MVNKKLKKKLLANSKCFGKHSSEPACAICKLSEDCAAQSEEEVTMTVKKRSKKQTKEVVEKGTKTKTEAEPKKRVRNGYDEDTIVKASYMSRKPVSEQPELTKGEKLLYNMLHEAFGFEFTLHTHNGVPRWIGFTKGPVKGFSMRGTPKGLAVVYKTKTVWVGNPDEVVSVIKKQIKEHPECVRTQKEAPVKKSKKNDSAPSEDKEKSEPSKKAKTTKSTKKTTKKSKK